MGQDINMVIYNRNYELKIKTQFLVEYPVFWLSNITFVEHIKLKISFKIFILSPILLTREHSCLGQRHQ